MDTRRLPEQLTRYLESVYPDRFGIHVTGLDEIKMGWETELFTVVVSSEKQGRIQKENMVIRVFSGENAGKKARKEFNLMRRLHEERYPVPEVYSHEETGETLGKPFILMERIMGKTLDETYGNEADESMHEGILRLLGLFARLHSLDAALFKGLPGVSYSNDLTQSRLHYYREASEGAISWVKPVVSWLGDNKPDGSEVQSLLHNDFHGMNVMLRRDMSPAVIDWSAAAIGDYRIDLGWTMLLYTTSGGAMFRDLVLDTYREVSGRKALDMKYFEVFAVTRRIIDLAQTMRGNNSAIGLKEEVAERMKSAKHHYLRCHDLIEARTGLRLAELDCLVDSF